MGDGAFDACSFGILLLKGFGVLALTRLLQRFMAWLRMQLERAAPGLGGGTAATGGTAETLLPSKLDPNHWLPLASAF